MPSPAAPLHGAGRAGGTRPAFTMPWLCRGLSWLLLDQVVDSLGLGSPSRGGADYKSRPRGPSTPVGLHKMGAVPAEHPLRPRTIVHKRLSCSQSWGSPRPGPRRRETLLGGGRRSQSLGRTLPPASGTGLRQVCPTREPGYRRGWSWVRAGGRREGLSQAALPLAGIHPCGEGEGLAHPGPAGCQAGWSRPAPRALEGP